MGTSEHQQAEEQAALDNERCTAIEKWLQEEVVPAYHELHKDPSRGLSVDQARAALAQRREMLGRS